MKFFYRLVLTLPFIIFLSCVTGESENSLHAERKKLPYSIDQSISKYAHITLTTSDFQKAINSLKLNLIKYNCKLLTDSYRETKRGDSSTFKIKVSKDKFESLIEELKNIGKPKFVYINTEDVSIRINKLGLAEIRGLFRITPKIKQYRNFLGLR